MFKFIRRKILEGMVKDFIQDLPKYKDAAILIFMEKKGEVIKRIEKAVLEALTGFFEEKLGKRLGNSDK